LANTLGLNPTVLQYQAWFCNNILTDPEFQRFHREARQSIAAELEGRVIDDGEWIMWLLSLWIQWAKRTLQSQRRKQRTDQPSTPTRSQLLPVQAPSLPQFTAPQILQGNPSITNPFTALDTSLSSDVLRQNLLRVHSEGVIPDVDPLIHRIKENLISTEKKEENPVEDVMQDVIMEGEGQGDQGMEVSDSFILTDRRTLLRQMSTWSHLHRLARVST
jgi:hypothetical protein